MTSRPSETTRLGRLWFALRTLNMRARFFTGKASFVEAQVRMTTHSIADGAAAADPRLLAHYELETSPPRTGTQGWELYAERVGRGPAHRTVALSCDFCGHRFIVQVMTAADPLAGELTGGRDLGAPASFSSDWFRFMDERFSGPTELFCSHCEQRGEASARHLLRR